MPISCPQCAVLRSADTEYDDHMVNTNGECKLHRVFEASPGAVRAVRVTKLLAEDGKGMEGEAEGLSGC